MTIPAHPAGLSQTASLAADPMDFAAAAAKAPMDRSGAARQDLRFPRRDAPDPRREVPGLPLGATPGGELSLEKAFSATGNCPMGKWASGTLSDAAYRGGVPAGARVPGYPNFGRADRLNGVSSDSWLAEILSGRGPVHGEKAQDRDGGDRRRFPFMTRCDGKTVPSGPNAGKPWGDTEVGP